jgi:hypothetical protein
MVDDGAVAICATVPEKVAADFASFMLAGEEMEKTLCMGDSRWSNFGDATFYIYRRHDNNIEYQIRYGEMVLAVMLKGMAKLFCTLCSRTINPPVAPAKSRRSTRSGPCEEDHQEGRAEEQGQESEDEEVNKIKQFTDDGVAMAGIETSAGSTSVRLYTEDGQGITFPDMRTLADFVGGAVGLVNGWKADTEYAELAGIRRKVADGITAEFKRQIALKDPAAAASFPEDVLFGGQWYIDVRKAKDPNYVQVTMEQHIKKLIASIADSFAVAREAA